MAVNSLIITGFVLYNPDLHDDIDDFLDKWTNDNQAFRAQIISYMPEFLELEFIPEGPLTRIKIRFQIEPLLFHLFFKENEEPTGSLYVYDAKAKGAAATLLERVLWIPPLAPRIRGTWFREDYGITSYTVDGTVIEGKSPPPGGDGGTRAG